MKVASSVARSKDDRPVAKIENQLVSNFSEQILLSNTAWSNYGPADGICAARGTILRKSCRLQAAATFFSKNAMILGRK